MRALVIIGLILALIGCSQKSFWYKPYVSMEEYNADIGACKYRVNVDAAVGEIPIDRESKLSAFSQCMQSKGYILKKISPKEEKLPTAKVDVAPQVQPTRVEKQQVAPPIAPSPSAHKEGVDIPSKSQLPLTENKKVPAFAAPPSNTDFVVVTGTSSNIRTGAGNKFPIVTTVNQGAKLTLLGEYGKWLNVRLENGQEGWIHSRFVQEWQSQ